MIGGNPFICKDEEWKEKRAEISPALTALKVFYFDVFYEKEGKLMDIIYSRLKVKPMFAVIEKICERMTKYVDEKIETGTNTFIAKEVTFMKID